jgi:hypothetical protein
MRPVYHLKSAQRTEPGPRQETVRMRRRYGQHVLLVPKDVRPFAGILAGDGDVGLACAGAEGDAHTGTMPIEQIE